MKRLLMTAVVTSFMIGPVLAQQQTGTPPATAENSSLAAETAALKKFHDSPPQGCTDKYIFLSGEATGTYAKIAEDMKKVDAVGKYFCIFQTQGGYNNAIHLAKNNADLGLVQVDGLDLVGKYDQHVSALKALVSLFPSAMHIVTMTKGVVVKKGQGWNGTDETKVVMTLSDFRDMPVAVWSSAVVTARNLNEANNLNMKLITVQTVPEGLNMLHGGQVVAFMGMGGRPVPWVEQLDRSHRLIGLNTAEMSSMFDKYPKSGYSKDALSYDNLGQVGVPTVASQVELVVQNLKSQRGANLLELRDALNSFLDDIRENRGAHQAWKLVTDDPTQTVWPAYEGPRARQVKTKGAIPVPPTPPK
jgi:TRAP-type uncharacterized transport system substrate-binding protein